MHTTSEQLPGPGSRPPTAGQSAADQVRAERRRTGRMLAVLDDDPTGSQSVHGVQVVTALDRQEYAAALGQSPSVCFVLTNTRGMAEAEAVALTTAVARDLHAEAAEAGRPLDLVSRSDSTLRGHVVAEVQALDRARREHHGQGYDAVLFAPAFFEAGRVTHDDVHWVVGQDGERPVGESESAADATFGYRSSDLREFLAERSNGDIRADDVVSVPLDAIRRGGVTEVAELLRSAPAGGFVVVNGTRYDDYDVVAAAALQVAGEGRSLLYRTGPSFVRSLAGLEASEPLTPAQVWDGGQHPDRHGVVVVGSHVGRTTAQLDHLLALRGVVHVVVDAAEAAAADPARRSALVDETAEQVCAALGRADVVLATSRTVVTGRDAEESLALSMRVSAVLSHTVRAALHARPAWVVAKGGITSHDVAVRGLGLRRAKVVGQFGPGVVSLFRPLAADPRAVGVPYVVFPGNVGGPTLLADVVGLLRGDERGDE